YVGEYVVAFLFKILIMYLMGIFLFTKYSKRVCGSPDSPDSFGRARRLCFLFYVESWNLTAKSAKEFLEFLNGIKSQGTQGWRILLETDLKLPLKCVRDRSDVLLRGT
ncbi:MAG: hypothetical protein ABIP27_00605, partial [Flavobacterium circumlabens]|uniref:hypothetical protein n=1 Tax=Flavobacterium circumlabens TaxID=2133765 RepID=UPI003263D4BF